MLRNYAKVALRNLLRYKANTAVNILGLAVGFTCVLLISLYVADERGFDRFHEHADSIYRMNWDFKNKDQEGVGPGTPPPLAAALARELPEVRSATRLYPVSDMVVRHGNAFFNEPNSGSARCF